MRTKPICENCPDCFGDWVYENETKDCGSCAFFMPCIKVANKVHAWDVDMDVKRARKK